MGKRKRGKIMNVKERMKLFDFFQDLDRRIFIDNEYQEYAGFD